ncbi:MAG: hypothetical protein JRJ29_22475, partial [Deltaproteobacteria bacterium]|nr:hypothetical protein [Deltaproteobacteria bacterium]
FPSSTIKITRVWATANIGGSDYLFDPAFKEYEYTGGINLSQAMGYSQASFLASARAGATIGADYVKNMDEANIRSNLENYSTNLVTEIRDNHPNASVREIVGGRKIVYEKLEEYPTTLPYAIQTENQTECTGIPDNYRLKLRVQHEGIDYTFASYQIAGKRVSIFYTGANNAPEPKVDGELIATGNSTTPGTSYDLTISMDHPYAAHGGTYCDEPGTTFKLKSGSSYIIASDFEGVSKDLIRDRNSILTENRHSGEPEQSDAVLGEALCVMGLTWLHVWKLSEVLMAQLAQVAYVHHHSVGVMAQEEGYYIDVKVSIVSETTIQGNEEDGWAWFRDIAGLGSAFEHGIREQLQGKDRIEGGYNPYFSRICELFHTKCVIYFIDSFFNSCYFFTYGAIG